MANLFDNPLIKRLDRFLFGVDEGFINGKGELGLRFDPHWPGPLLGEAGHWQNYLLAIVAIALFVLISRKTAGRELHRLRIAVAGLSAVAVALIVPSALGFQWWSILLVVAVVGAVAWFYFKRHEIALMALGRLSLFGLLLMTLSGPLAWNLVLGGSALGLIIYVYRQEGKTTGPRVFMGILRGALIAFVLVLLNNPILNRSRTITEPSVVAVLVDDSLSMSIHDVNPSQASSGETRLQAAVNLFDSDGQALIKRLAKIHTLQFYSFDQSATSIGSIPGPNEANSRDIAPSAIDKVSQQTLIILGLIAALFLAAPFFVRLLRREWPHPSLSFGSVLVAALLVGIIFIVTRPDQEQHDLNVRSEGPIIAVKSSAPDLAALKAEGASTQVVPSILKVLGALQGQRVAGVVIVTDGRDTPTSPLAEAYKQLTNYGIKVYPIAVGSEKPPKNIALQAVNVQDSAFKDDIVNMKVVVRASGYEPGHAITLRLTNAANGLPLKAPDGGNVEKVIHPADSNPVQEELLFKPDAVGTLKIKVEAVRQPGELDEDDNILQSEISVLDAKINVLYVEGYPRWEYRYIKNEMIRDKTVNISCILTSADPNFAQEHTDMEARGERDKYKYFPYAQFPGNMEQLMECDVVLFGDVDPRQFTDSQLQLIRDFVDKKGGGFGMIAGPQWSPAAYKNTPIYDLLPVSVVNTDAGWPTQAITEGFRPVLTKDGAASSFFRFFTDKAKNDKYIKDDLQPLFWYRQGLVAKSGTDVYAEHPTDLDPTGNHKAPLLVLGRFGSGRTLLSAFDDSWRWRFYTGESVFDTYWIQELRYLARGKKLGRRTLTFAPERKVYQLGDEVHLNLRVMDPALLRQLSPKIEVQLRDEKTGQVVQSVMLQNSTSQPDYYTASFGADRVGHFKLEVHDDAISRVAQLDEVMDVIIPKLELVDPAVDKTTLAHVASESGGVALTIGDAGPRLPELIQSASRTIAPPDDHPLWDKPIAMVIFVLLLTSEWVLRKVFGMV
ncbi:MAG TPA: hypothetical protein VFE47_21330 [Tepidisphaeraceae bacterium]|jgi:uncharacterized membrane protein|nr:hypothetical protein [Tepidisphaeraceae bacterium]